MDFGGKRGPFWSPISHSSHFSFFKEIKFTLNITPIHSDLVFLCILCGYSAKLQGKDLSVCSREIINSKTVDGIEKD